MLCRPLAYNNYHVARLYTAAA